MMNPCFTTRTLLSTLAVTAAIATIACSGSPIATAPLAPSAVPAVSLAVESGDDTAMDDSATFGALDKGKDKGKDGKGKDGKDKDGTTTTTDSVVEAEGAVVTATGTCPAKTFTIGTRSFTTSAGTTYKHGACADVVAKADVEVRATRQADGTLLATRVEFEDADEGEDDEADDDEKDKGEKDKDKGKDKDKTGKAEDDGDDAEGDEDEDAEDGARNPHHGAGPHDGTVSHVRGTCPVVTFVLKGLRVSTTDKTKYEGGTCATLRANVKVRVTGTAGTTERTFVADTITIVRTPNVRTH